VTTYRTATYRTATYRTLSERLATEAGFLAARPKETAETTLYALWFSVKGAPASAFSS